MLEGLIARAAAAATGRTDRKRDQIAAELREAAPRGVGVGLDGEEVVLSGRGLLRRLMRDGALRAWLERTR